MRFVIVTGMSGAGRSTALKTLEDFGFFCVDNLPVPLIPKFLELANNPASGINEVAVGVDVRNLQVSPELPEELLELKKHHPKIEILYFEASDACLIKRYKETRRSHPLAMDSRVEDGILKEREFLEEIRKHADYIVDTSTLLTKELRSEITRIFKEGEKFGNLFVTVLSFGFKYGIPVDCDLVFDVRFLPNPYYVEDLRPLTGNNPRVRDFVMEGGLGEEFLTKTADLVQFLLPNYIKEGKNQLVIGIGCTGGKHRSVTIANALAEELKKYPEYGLKLEHRDVERV